MSHDLTPRRVLLKLVSQFAGVSRVSGFTPVPQQKPVPVALHQMGSYRCGGADVASLKRLQAQSNEFNIGFWMVGGPGGAYLADVPIQIKSGGQNVASFIADGPLCYLKLPAGSYIVVGVHNGQTRSMQMQSGSMNNYLRW